MRGGTRECGDQDILRGRRHRDEQEENTNKTGPVTGASKALGEKANTRNKQQKSTAISTGTDRGTQWRNCTAETHNRSVLTLTRQTVC